MFICSYSSSGLQALKEVYNNFFTLTFILFLVIVLPPHPLLCSTPIFLSPILLPVPVSNAWGLQVAVCGHDSAQPGALKGRKPANLCSFINVISAAQRTCYHKREPTWILLWYLGFDFCLF